MTRIRQFGSYAIFAALLSAAAPAWAQTPAPTPARAAAAQPADGSHDFDFLIGTWKVHLKKLVGPLTGSTDWVEYDGTSVTHKLLNSNANMEAFEVDSPARHMHWKGQTLRLYNPASGQWSIYGFDVDKGQLVLPATIGRFYDGQGELYDQEDWKGQWIEVRYVWNHDGDRARMVQSFSTDGGKTWEANWICDMTRVGD